MDNNFKIKQQFAHKLNEDLARLAQKWDVGLYDDPRIEDIRKSGQSILDRVEFDLARMSVGSPYEDHQEFFVGLTDKDYTPRISGNSLAPNSEDRKAAHQLLKNLAAHIGATIHSDNTTILADVQNSANAVSGYVDLSGNGFKDTTPNPPAKKPEVAPAVTIEAPQEADNSFEWTYEIPKAEAIDELTALRDEASRIKEVITKATSASALREYIKDTLSPRLREVKQELKTRRESFDNDISYQMINADMIDFAESLEILMLQGLRRIKPQASEPKPMALAAPTEPESFEIRLAKLASRIDAGLERAQGAQLKDFYDNRLKPKLISLKDEIENLKISGADQNAVHEKELHFGVIKEAMKTAYQKIQAEKTVEAPAVAPKAKDFYRDVLKPEALALIADIQTMKQSGSDPVALEIKERRLAVLKTSMSAILHKRNEAINAEMNATSAKTDNLPLLTEEALEFPTLPVIEGVAPIAEPWTPKDQVPFKFADAATIEAPTDFPTLPAAVVEYQVEPRDEQQWLNTVPAQTDVAQEADNSEPPVFRSPNVTKFLAGELDNQISHSSNDVNNPKVISDVKFRMQKHPPIDVPSVERAANEPNFIRRHWKAAVAAVASAGAAFAIAAGVVFSGAHPAPDAQLAKKDVTPEPTAQVVQQAVVQQQTVVAAVPPANDVAPAPVAEIATPEPVIEAAPVTPTIQAKVPAIVKHFVAKVKAAAPSEPTVDVQDNTPLVAKPWDIATSRVDLETWNNACKFLKANSSTGENGICPS